MEAQTRKILRFLDAFLVNDHIRLWKIKVYNQVRNIQLISNTTGLEEQNRRKFTHQKFQNDLLQNATYFDIYSLGKTLPWKYKITVYI